MKSDSIILGIDPGTTIMGFGLIKVLDNQLEMVQLHELILKKFAARTAAKQHGDFKLADQIRDELLNKGIIIEDQKDKTTWKYK